MERVQAGADRQACKQVADQLRAGIEAGTWPPGELLPSPRVLSDECGCHVDTARRAVAIIRSEGLCRTVPGMGSVVLGDDPVRTHEVFGPARITVRMPSQLERQELDVPEGVPLILIERPVDAEDDPAVVEQLLGHQTVIEIPAHP